MTHQEAVDTFASERYLLDEMNEYERQAFEGHFFSCPECADDLKVGALMKKAASADGEKSARSSGRRWRPSVVLPWAAAAMFALAAGYETLTVEPALRRAGQPQALIAVTLRPASRGREVVLSSSQSGTLLALDLPGNTDARELTYTIVGPRGPFASQTTATPEAGTPLFVVLPSSLPLGEYTVRLTEARAGGVVLGEYRFMVK